MEEENVVLRFLLPDLLGKPKMMTDREGNFVALVNFDLPPDNYVFFIPVKEWEEFKPIGGKG